MMDPLSLTFAVISLASTAKDMVELGQKIRKSFSRVSDSYRDAERAAEEIEEMVQEIKLFCDHHEDVLADMEDFRVALSGLLSKFRSYEASILPLLPQNSGKRKNFFIRGWDAWRNCSRIERSTINLQRDVATVMRRYMMKSAMRTEVKLGTIHQETSRSLINMQNDINQGLDMLEVVRRDISALRLTTATAAVITPGQYGSSTTDEFSHNIIMFAQSTPSTSAPMLQTPNVITDELITTAYIKFQLNIIIRTLEERSMLPMPISNSNSKFLLAPILEHDSMSVNHLRHHIVRQVTSMSDLLETDYMQTTTIEDGVALLTELAVGLHKLGMGHESVLVGNWAIILTRTLVDASGGSDPDRAAGLALCLANQSITIRVDDNKIQSLQAIEEAYAITQNLREQYNGAVHFQFLHSIVLLQYARLVDNRRAIEMSIEAVHILEDTLSVQALIESTTDKAIGSIATPDPVFLDRLFQSASPLYVIIQYARALQDLGAYLAGEWSLRRHALDLTMLAIAVYRHMILVHGRRHSVHLAVGLSQLLLSGAAHSIPGKELIIIAEECSQLLRKLVEKNPLLYAPQLANTLSVKGRTLETLGRDDEAIATWEEVDSLARQVLQNTRLRAVALYNLSRRFRNLKRLDDAARTLRLAITTHQENDEIQGARYFDLSKDLRTLHRFTESVESARQSVILFKRVMMTDPDRWSLDLAITLAHLSSCLGASGNFSAALKEWKQAVSLLDNLLDPGTGVFRVPTVFKMYLATLNHHPLINHSHISPDGEECLEVCTTAVGYLQLLLPFFRGYFQGNADITESLLWAEFCYTYNMLRLGRLQTAQEYIGNWFDRWPRSLEAALGFRIAKWHMAMSVLKSKTLDAQGYTEQALLAIETVRGISQELSVDGTQSPYFLEVINSTVSDAQLQLNHGNNEAALQVSEEALRLSRANTRQPVISGLLPSLHAVAFTALARLDYRRAAEIAQEGCSIYASLGWQSKSEHNIYMRPSLSAILSSAEANLGRCSEALEHAQHAVNLSQEIKSMKTEISATTAELLYMETRGNLAEILVAIGEFPQAREICEQGRIYFSKRVELRKGEYRELAPILRMLSILFCTEGRHEEGENTAHELSRIMTMLGDTLPSLQEQVKMRLRHQIKVPILKVLDELSDVLDCGHQAGISSLFEE